MDLRICRAPDIRIGRAEEEDAGRAHRSGEVRDAGVVAKVEPAALEDGGQLRQRQGARKERGRLSPVILKGRELRIVGFSADDEEARRGQGRAEAGGKLQPVFDRPVLLRAAAAGVDGEKGAAFRGSEKGGGGGAVLG